ncbi:MAG: hypothetical protein FD138_2445 [Planctomycetota bacterium]|nr:MAG: hypothetical protein FD138_2445 [Planctomycetota bacterium]
MASRRASALGQPAVKTVRGLTATGPPVNVCGSSRLETELLKASNKMTLSEMKSNALGCELREQLAYVLKLGGFVFVP